MPNLELCDFVPCRAIVTLGILLGLCATGAPAADALPPARLLLKSRTLLDVGETSPRHHAFYVRREGPEMMTFASRSSDNGRTWVRARPTPNFNNGLPKGFRRHTYAGFVDPVEDALLVLVLALDVPELDPKIKEPPIGQNEYYLRYRVSLDGGKTFLFDEPIRQKGDYDDRHPIDGVWLGKNGYYLGDAGCRPIRTQAGKILVPVQVPLLGEDGKLSNPGGGFTYQYTRVLIGTWTDGHKLEWDVSDKIEGDPDRSSRGLFEPTLIEFSDGRILCVMRGSNGGKRDPQYEWPAYKWQSVSSDGGRTWSKAQPWTYSDGSEFFSPSSMSQLLRHSSGRTFWIGNLNDENCRANHPRHPLVIGEVDPQSLGLIKSTVLVLDSLQEDDRDGLSLSHWLAYEDRESGDVIIPMRRSNKKYTQFRGVEYMVEVK